MTQNLERYEPNVDANGLNTEKAIDFSAAPTCLLPALTYAGGSLVATVANVATIIAGLGVVLTDQTTGQTIGATGARLTKLWATDITVTNAIAGAVTGNAGTVTNATLTTALTVNTGAVTLAGQAGGSSVTLPSTGTLATLAGTETLTNKRITPRVGGGTTYTTDTGTSINGDTQDYFIVTAQAGALKFNNPTGTPTDGQKLIITVASSTTAARALTWDTAYGATTVALPSTTAATTVTLTIGFIWSASKSLWQCVAVA